MIGPTAGKGAQQRRAPQDVTIHDRRITVDGMNVQYLDAGAGRPLLLLHGHEQSASGWRWVIPALARSRRVLAVSLPGHGGTDPAVGAYKPGRDLVPFVLDVLDAIGVGAVDVAGNSSGGAIALRLALGHPDRVRTLTLVDCRPRPRGESVAGPEHPADGRRAGDHAEPDADG